MKTKIKSILKLTNILVFVFLVSILNPSFSQDVKISSRVDSTNVMIGDEIPLVLSATFNPQKFKIQFPMVLDSFNHFEIVEKLKPDTTSGRDENTIRQTIQLTNFDSGQWVIPSYNFEILSLEGELPQTFRTDSIVMNVNTIAVDTSKPFKPIMSIRSASMPWQVLLMYILGALVLVLILGILIWYFVKTLREKNNKPIKKNPEVILLPHEKALRNLTNIEQEQKWLKEEEKNYHTELTDVIRNYLEEQFKIDCFEKTSSEIVQQVKKIKALSTSRQSLRTIFETAVMVKFAKSKPTLEEHENCLVLAKEFILESYKRIKPLESDKISN